MKANRKVRDSVFSLYLTEDPKRLVETYNAMQETDYPLNTPVEINTLEDALDKYRLDGISFLLNKQYIILLEQQSAISENMPLRLFLYVTRLYAKIYSGKNAHRKRLIKLPRPEFFILYNGDEPYPQESFLQLSDAFAHSPDEDKDIELGVRVLNISYTPDNPVLQRSRSLREYSFFIHQIKTNRISGMSLEDAIHEAVLYCKQCGIMQPFLTKHASEVENMLLKDWSWNDALKVECEEAYEEGIAQGCEQEKLKLIKSFLGTLPDEVIAEKAGVSLSVIAQLKRETPQES